HMDYGIAIYRGIKLQDTNGEKREVLVLEFRDEQYLYVSMVHAGKISRYLGAAGRVKKSCKALAQFPGTTRDIAFVAPETLTNGEVIDFIRKCKAANFESVRLFDIFVGEDLKKQNKKSMAYSLSFRNQERTLTDNEVNAAMEKIRTRLAAELKVELR
ncbi:MAG: hypothetical protein J6W00_09320, partial [Lentisphaeria bacterium]|nr:hypothetical protein [Lentisphaeria bacterium]